MKKILFFILFVASFSVKAEWTKLTFSKESRVYIDKQSVTKNGDIAEVNQMFDFFNPQKSPDNEVTYKSSSGREAYNCKTNQNKTISFIWHTDNMGKGKVLYVDKGHKDYLWEKIPKDSLSDAIRREICK